MNSQAYPCLLWPHMISCQFQYKIILQFFANIFCYFLLLMFVVNSIKIPSIIIKSMCFVLYIVPLLSQLINVKISLKAAREVQVSSRWL